MATSSIGGRTTLLLRNLCTKSKTKNSSISIPTSLRFTISPSSSSTSSRFSLHQSPISPSSFRLPRELSSLLPVHSAIASACLVSRLPDTPCTSAECRFANYVTPI